MPQQDIDYDALAAQHGGVAAPAVDYDALAAQYGAKVEGAAAAPPASAHPQPRWQPAGLDVPRTGDAWKDAQAIGQRTGEVYGPAMQMALGGGGLKNVAAGAEALAPAAKPILKGGWQILDAASFDRVGKIYNALKTMGQEVGEAINPAKFPGANLPATPPAELLQARTLAEGGKVAAAEPAAALRNIPVAELPPRQPPPGGPAGPFRPPAPKVPGTVDLPFQGGRPLPPREPPPGGPAGPFPRSAPRVPGTADFPFQRTELPTTETPATAPAKTPARVQNTPPTLRGESALRQVLTGQDNANLMKIAKSRGINVAQEAQLKPGYADNRIIAKIIGDFSPEELHEVEAQYMENTRFRHSFGDIGPEAWKTMSLKTYFPEVKISAAQIARTDKAIADIKSAAAQAQTASEDLTPEWQAALKQIQASKAAQ